LYEILACLAHFAGINFPGDLSKASVKTSGAFEEGDLPVDCLGIEQIRGCSSGGPGEERELFPGVEHAGLLGFGCHWELL